MIEGAIISIIQRETQNRTLAINTGQILFPTFFGQKQQAAIYRDFKTSSFGDNTPKSRSFFRQ